MKSTKKFEGILICTDLDGTLLRDDKTISRENTEAIEYFKSEGGYFTFVTGRMPSFVSKMYNAINPNAPFGCINGGGIFDHRTMKYVWTQSLDRSALEMVAAVDKEVDGVGIQVNTFDTIYFNKDNETMVHFRQETGLPNLSCHYNDVPGELAKVVFGSDEEEDIQRLISVLNSHPLTSKFGYIRSEKRLYEILPKGISKGSVLMKLAEILSVSPERTIAVGDYNNDVAMLKAAGIGIAVKNASPEALAAADMVTVSNEEHAIARIIYDIDSGKIKI